MKILKAIVIIYRKFIKSLFKIAEYTKIIRLVYIYILMLEKKLFRYNSCIHASSLTIIHV